MAKIKYAALLFILLSSPVLFGQDIKTVRDIGVWANIGMNYKISKQWRLTFKSEARFFDNVSELGKVTAEFGGQYKINKQFKLGANVRYAYDRKGDYTFTHDIRYNIDLKYKLKLNKSYQLEYRFRYQDNFVDLFTYYDENVNKSHTRHRLEVQRDLKAHSIVLGAELFREYVIYRKPYFNILRITLSDQLKTKLGEVEYSLNYRRELNTEYPLNFFFIRLGYTFNFKHG